TSSLFIGRSGSRNQLVVANGASVSSGEDGYLGYNPNANQNAAIVTDPGTRLLLASNLYVGNYSAFSRIIVSNGALVRNAAGLIGGAFSSTNNLAVVTGPGSTWFNANDLRIGFNSVSNQLVVSNGAVVVNTWGEIGGGSSSSVAGSNNLVIVTGSGSV